MQRQWLEAACGLFSFCYLSLYHWPPYASIHHWPPLLHIWPSTSSSVPANLRVGFTHGSNSMLCSASGLKQPAAFLASATFPFIIGPHTLPFITGLPYSTSGPPLQALCLQTCESDSPLDLIQCYAAPVA